MSQDVMIGRNLRRFSADEVGFFEGPEKLLEVWFEFCSDLEDKRGLRMLPRFEWEKILEIAQCKILSVCSNDCIDAYLLSESTLLISRQRFILKTCGNTTLLSAIPPLISLVDKYFPGSLIMNLYYSHRSFLQPLLQPQPHSDFDLEVSYLNKILNDGVSRRFGKGDDLWYLYGFERKKLNIQDQTLEVLMNDLNPDFMALFSSVAFASSQDLVDALGLPKLMPDAIIDAKIFEPCGFSLNAIDKNVYYTIHVTPQIECSWVSFETNLEVKRCLPLIRMVLDVFRPGKATVSLMATEDIKDSDVKSVIDKRSGYSQTNYERSSLSAYTVVYMELHAESNVDGGSCLSKAVSWTKMVSKQAQNWMVKNIYF